MKVAEQAYISQLWHIVHLSPSQLQLPLTSGSHAMDPSKPHKRKRLESLEQGFFGHPSTGRTTADSKKANQRSTATKSGPGKAGSGSRPQVPQEEEEDDNDDDDNEKWYYKERPQKMLRTAPSTTPPVSAPQTQPTAPTESPSHSKFEGPKFLREMILRKTSPQPSLNNEKATSDIPHRKRRTPPSNPEHRLARH